MSPLAEIVAPLGSSPRADAVVELIRETAGVTKIMIGPSVAGPCPSGNRIAVTPHDTGALVTVPLTGGFRRLILSLAPRTRSDDLRTSLAAKLNRVTLPPELVEARPTPKASRSARPARTQPRRVAAAAPPKIVPTPALEPEPVLAAPVAPPPAPVTPVVPEPPPAWPLVAPPPAPLTPAKLQIVIDDAPPPAEIGNADTLYAYILTLDHGHHTDFIIFGLADRLVSRTGRALAQIELWISELEADHRLQISTRDVTEPYRRYRIFRPLLPPST